MSERDNKLRVASDVGGTFTDLVYYAKGIEGGAVQIIKTDTTPPNFEQGVLSGVRKAGINASDIDFFAHGSTVVINALTERKGALTALLTTAGFRDVLEIARGNRPDLFNFNFRKPPPFVERHLRHEVTERVDYHGQVQMVADLSALKESVEYFKSQGVEAIAIAFMHAYANSENERKVADEVRKLWPDVSILASHEVSREWREYERTNTTVLSAYVHPVAKAYIQRLEDKLASEGMHGSPYMMQSNGGITTSAAAKRNPIVMVESGPASGIFAAACLGHAIGEKNLLVLDIGGTTAKCALINQGEFKVTTEYHIEKTNSNPGYPIQTAVSEIVEIGNGGGSIAWIDAGDKMHVGPKSAGANPGPSAYGRGGTHATTTDANLLLGRIDPNSFVGGEVAPDWGAVDKAFTPLCEKLNMTKEDVARGVVQTANANMANALRLVSTNKGYDPREFSLIAFGGGGAMHAVSLGVELNVRKVIVPIHSSVFSAWGMLLTDLRRDYVQTRPLNFDFKFQKQILDAFAHLQSTAISDYTEDGVITSADEISFELLGDMRYQGQEHTVKVPLQFSKTMIESEFDNAREMFHVAHEKRFTYRLPNAVQIVNFHVVAIVTVEKPELVERPSGMFTLDQARIGRRSVDFYPDGNETADIYDGTKLDSTMTVQGPAVIQEPSVTLPIPTGCVVSIDTFGNYHIDLGRS